MIRKDGSRDAIVRIQHELWTRTVSAGTTYRPPTYISRMTELEDDQNSLTSKIPERTAWYAWLNPNDAFPLIYLGGDWPPSSGIKVYSEDYLLLRDDSLTVSISSGTQIKDLDSQSIVNLMWWRVGDYIGVTTALDPRNVLLLLPGTHFSFGRCRFQVTRVDEDSSTVELSASQQPNPWYVPEGG